MTRLPGFLLAMVLPGAALAAEVLFSSAAPLDAISDAHSADVTQARVWGLPVNTTVQIAPAGRLGSNRALVHRVYAKPDGLWWGSTVGDPTLPGLVQHVPDPAAWTRFHVDTLRLFRAVRLHGKQAYKTAEIESIDGQLRLRAELPAPGATAAPYAVVVTTPDIETLRARLVAAGIPLAADVQLLRLTKNPLNFVRALAVRVPESGVWIEVVQPGAQPMSETELLKFTASDRMSRWTRFNNQLTGMVWWRADGSAHVKWDQGNLDVEGTRTVRGDTVCTAWKGLREGRELCVRHYRLWGEVTQSFRVNGTPDGIHFWEPIAKSP